MTGAGAALLTWGVNKVLDGISGMGKPNPTFGFGIRGALQLAVGAAGGVALENAAKDQAPGLGTAFAAANLLMSVPWLTASASMPSPTPAMLAVIPATGIMPAGEVSFVVNDNLSRGVSIETPDEQGRVADPTTLGAYTRKQWGPSPEGMTAGVGLIPTPSGRRWKGNVRG